MYSEYQMRLSNILNKFLNKCTNTNQPIRQMNPAEFEMLSHLSKINRQINLLIMQLSAISSIIDAIDKTEMYAVKCNVWRIIQSLTHQRDKMRATKAAFATIAPNNGELTAIKDMTRSITKRIQFLETVIIPENLKLTPIYDYLEIQNRTFAEELRIRFPNYIELIDTLQHNKNALAEYIHEILTTTEQAGHKDDYKERLIQYNHAKAQKDMSAVEQQELREKENRRISILKDYMQNFQSAFYESLRNIKPNPIIGINTEIGLRKAINIYGKGSYVVLCCSVYHDRPHYQYVRANLLLSPHISDHTVFKTKTDANEACKICVQKYPTKLFDIIQLR